VLLSNCNQPYHFNYLSKISP